MEKHRLAECKKGIPWKEWGPYLSERQWGTVREDYTAHGDAWSAITHDMARSKAYRWGEDGIGGFSDADQRICFSWSFWNGNDPIVKERLFGLAGNEGNHGEDVKELYYYLDSTPTHSYMKMLYKYPMKAFPYSQLVDRNKTRSREEREYELIDTGIFDNDEYFDIFLEYAKIDFNDFFFKCTVHNRSQEEGDIFMIPNLWFRNTWSSGKDTYIPEMTAIDENTVLIKHNKHGNWYLYFEEEVDRIVYYDNETNSERLYGIESK